MSRLLPALLDVLLVLVFAAVGRRSHAEGLDVTGVLRTALPFLVGTATGWLLASVVLESGPRSLAWGAVVVVATVAVGMALRALAAQGVAVSFVVVATTVLAAFLVGWRLVARLLPA
ncbi:DUF3054 domain-containing protein [Phycicoccus sp.]|uniref:DUF3054 domain-containing protein n=1 Tax=Phycicoccus sp. TaxID=1902410 RepID=UPI002C044B8B|nr:DUF3054 domain-containing protein [Phycicoccus sp.]HMM96336.1 DUF3054 domain-containing protein [Phycicoccus sp.]